MYDQSIYLTVCSVLCSVLVSSPSSLSVLFIVWWGPWDIFLCATWKLWVLFHNSLVRFSVEPLSLICTATSPKLMTYCATQKPVISSNASKCPDWTGSWTLSLIICHFSVMRRRFRIMYCFSVWILLWFFSWWVHWSQDECQISPGDGECTEKQPESWYHQKINRENGRMT